MIESNNERNLQISSLESGICGAASGVIARALLQPLDVLKIRFQLQYEPLNKKQGHYHGLVQASKSIYQQEGLLALWKGHVPAQALTVSYTLGQFSAYTFFQKQASDLGIKNGLSSTICGGMAGVVGTLFCQPFDVARTRIVAQNVPEFTGILDVWKKIIAQENVFQLWKGLTPTLAMTIPFTAIQFRIYFLLSDWASSLDVSGGEIFGYQMTKSVACGSVAGVVAKISIYPLDVLKKRVQLRGAEKVRINLGKVIEYRSLWDCILKTTADEGVFAWFKGLQTSLIKSAAFSAVVFAFYDYFCHLVIVNKNTKD